MERYTITVAPPGAAPTRLLIPFPPTSSVSALSAEVQRRLARSEPNVPDLIFHLGDTNGPILDEDDLLEDVIIDPKGEAITATPRSNPSTTASAPALYPESNRVSYYSTHKLALMNLDIHSTRTAWNKRSTGEDPSHYPRIGQSSQRYPHDSSLDYH
jgi:hypothetical protein